VLHRDDYTCQYCGKRVADGAELVVDHIQPYSRGGSSDKDNLITACKDCNVGKGAKIVSNYPMRKDGKRAVQENAKSIYDTMTDQERIDELAMMICRAKKRALKDSALEG
jgi:5-methylcytosine-specific restriction endonuclease McrA